MPSRSRAEARLQSVLSSTLQMSSLVGAISECRMCDIAAETLVLLSGGWGFSTENISLVMGFLGVAGAIYALLFFASFTSRFGTRGMIQVAGVAQAIVYSWPITSNILLRHGFTRIFMAILPAMLLMQAVAGISAGSE